MGWGAGPRCAKGKACCSLCMSVCAFFLVALLSAQLCSWVVGFQHLALVLVLGFCLSALTALIAKLLALNDPPICFGCGVKFWTLSNGTFGAAPHVALVLSSFLVVLSLVVLAAPFCLLFLFFLLISVFSLPLDQSAAGKIPLVIHQCASFAALKLSQHRSFPGAHCCARFSDN